MTRFNLNRRAMLGAGVTLAFAGSACGAWATQGGRQRKMVVIVARGAMDGLSVTVPYGDAAYAGLRRSLAIGRPGETGGALELGEGFGLNPALAGMHALHRAVELRYAPAAAIPARIRSHFDAQDVLESGGGQLRAQTDGWLNRALAAASGGLSGLAVGAQTPLLMRGGAEVGGWSPGGAVRGDERIASLLQDLYADDPLLGPSLASGLEVEAAASRPEQVEGEDVPPPARRGDLTALGQSVAQLMTGSVGSDLVALSIDGWDTHARQKGQLDARLAQLDQLIGGLKTGLGPIWSDTVLVVATEFGRTVRANGTLGTDHGTASSLLLAGGALKAGGPLGDWPGLAEARLYEGRDLAPTLDVRSVFKGLLRDHVGLDRADIEQRVFPDSAAAPILDGLV